MPGQYFDKETNLHYNYFRDYDPAIGRYIQSDPIGLQGGINTYLYATDPLTQIDPMGLMGRDGAPTRGGYRKQTEPPTTYFGGEFHFFVGGGLSSVSCKDECGNPQTFRYVKVCGGLAAGGSATTGAVSNMSGRNCRSGTYEGWFKEIGGGIGPISGGADFGYNKAMQMKCLRKLSSRDWPSST